VGQIVQRDRLQHGARISAGGDPDGLQRLGRSRIDQFLRASALDVGERSIHGAYGVGEGGQLGSTAKGIAARRSALGGHDALVLELVRNSFAKQQHLLMSSQSQGG
jgi:hypothetical protein